MSRNLCSTKCVICHQSMLVMGSIHPITPDEAGAYFKLYEGMRVADASCVDCGAKYLAWVRRKRHSQVPADDLSVPFEDLSFRSTFNDEPGPDDLPPAETLARIHLKWTIEVMKQRLAHMSMVMTKELGETEEWLGEESRWERYRRLT